MGGLYSGGAYIRRFTVSVVHRPFYISICIATLPTQHTTVLDIQFSLF